MTFQTSYYLPMETWFLVPNFEQRVPYLGNDVV